MRFLVLGPLGVVGAAGELTPTTPKLRQVLALLLLHRHRIVQVDEFVRELWGENPPPSAIATLQSYVYKLRRLLVEPRAGAAVELVRTRPQGYLIDLETGELDLHRFEALVAEGRHRLDQDEPERASAALGAALALWRGPVLSDVVTGSVLGTEVTRLREARLQVLELRIDTDLELGRHRELIGELRGLTADHPLHESFQGKLMLALHCSGRRHDALEVYRRLRDTLDRELGLAPSPVLARLHQALLADDPALDRPHRRAVVTGGAGTTPAQLPPDLGDLTGYERELAAVERWLTPTGDQGPPTAVSVTGGPAIGKTALAVRAAHRVRAAFPDGQLFADLGGTGHPADPADVLERFLHALGVDDEWMPASLDERAALFRARTADRGMLVVLDDAGSAAQVRSLLPGSARCAVLVTSRRARPAGERGVTLRGLDPSDGVALLAAIVGRHRVDAEPDAAERIVRCCAGVPLALRAVGAQLQATADRPMRSVVERVERSRRRVSALRFGDFDVRAGFDACLAHLTAPERTAFILLALLPPGEFTLADAVDLYETGAGTAAALLGRLVEEHLVELVAPDRVDGPRYALTGLTRCYAQERLAEGLGENVVVPRQAGPRPEDRGHPVGQGHDAGVLGNFVLLESAIPGVVLARRLRPAGDDLGVG